jgi:hypothetical protein
VGIVLVGSFLSHRARADDFFLRWGSSRRTSKLVRIEIVTAGLNGRNLEAVSLYRVFGMGFLRQAPLDPFDDIQLPPRSHSNPRAQHGKENMKPSLRTGRERTARGPGHTTTSATLHSSLTRSGSNPATNDVPDKRRALQPMHNTPSKLAQRGLRGPKTRDEISARAADRVVHSFLADVEAKLATARSARAPAEDATIGSNAANRRRITVL